MRTNKKSPKRRQRRRSIRQLQEGFSKFLQALGEDPYVKRQAALFASEQHDIAMQQP